MLYAKSNCVKAVSGIPVIAALGFITFIYYGYMTTWVERHQNEASCIIWTTIITIGLCMVYWSYAMCLTTNPGNIPTGFSEIPEPGFAKPTYCSKCKWYRPARAHHCSLWNKCILKMDHHCPWVGNCVGGNNHKYFVQFLVYSFSTCWLTAFIMFTDIAEDYNNITTFHTVAALCAFIGSLSVGMLGLGQLIFVTTNSTTLEIKGLAGFISDWDLEDWYENMVEVFGKPTYLWWVPIRLEGQSDYVRSWTDLGAQEELELSAEDII